MSVTIYLEKLLKIADRQINRQAVGYEKISVGSSTIMNLTPPAQSMVAIITVEASGTASNPAKAVRFLETPSGTVSASNGMILGDLDTYEIFGADGIANFQAIGIESGKTHTLNVTYYK